jgi:SAM-dependent methyltransferase
MPMPLDEHRAANLANWEDRVPIHLGEGGYPVDAIATDPGRLSDVVEYDRRFVGNVAGKTLLHPQCHIGTDTLSWAKLGATVTGIDFSPSALDAARNLAARLGIEATFIESELYESPRNLRGTFDIVYTGVGAVCWLPDIGRWADVMAGFTKPGGRFYIRDGHPMLNALEEREDDQLVVTETYFETEIPQTWDEPRTYAGEGTLANTVTYEWNHGIGEIITALVRAGFRIDHVGEHKTLDWKALPHMIEVDGRWMLPESQRDKLPLAFSIQATRG